MILQTSDDQLMFLAGFDYCLGRMSYMVGVCIDSIVTHWPQLDAKHRLYIVREIETAIERGRVNADREDWQGLLDWIKEQG